MGTTDLQPSNLQAIAACLESMVKTPPVGSMAKSMENSLPQRLMLEKTPVSPA
jgi:hypothetical protein